MEPCLKTSKIAIVGAGPSGMYCALNILSGLKNLSFNNYKLTVFDKSQALRTILPTGNGRCNITNSICDISEFCANYPRGEKFLYSLFSRHFNYDSLEFFSSIGIKTYVQDDGRVFPVSNSAKDVKDKMLQEFFKYKNAKLCNKKISSFDELKEFDYVVIASGSRDTSELIKSCGHLQNEFKPSLCALNIENPIYPKGVSVQSLDGDFVFTDKGISGPLAFKISSLNSRNNFPYDISIRLFDVDKLIEEIKLNPKKSIANMLSKFVPKSLAQAIVGDEDKNSCEVAKIKLVEYSNLNLKVISHGLNGEIVNSGGVLLNELDKNCKSKIQNNLWFCGEILDIDGFCGGFNLQNCWSSAHCVAQDIIKTISE